MVSEREFRAQLGFKEQIVYHYCSLEALYGIVSSQSFWLASLHSTNDKKELQYGQKILNDVLQDMINDDKHGDLRKIFETISTAPGNAEYKKHRMNHRYYGASFVEHPDSLTHWERYGNNGYGVCIAFNVWMFKNFFECLALPDVCTTWLWHNRIIYDDSLQKEYIRNNILSMISSFTSEVGICNTPNVCNTIYYVALSNVKPMFKHSGFSDEKEYRLVFEEGRAEEMSDYFYKIALETDCQELLLNISKHIKEAQ